MSKKNMLFLSLVMACFVAGYSARLLWNSRAANDTATAEKSAEFTSATNTEIAPKAVKMQVRPNLGQEPAK